MKAATHIRFGLSGLTIALLAAAPLSAQAPPALSQVTAWRMSFTTSASGSGKVTEKNGDTKEYTFSVQASGSALLDQKTPPSWHGSPTIKVSLRYTGKATYGTNCVVTDEVLYDGPQRNLTTDAILSFASATGYSIRFGDENIWAPVKTTSQCPPSSSTTTKNATIQWSPTWGVRVPYPQGAAVLSGVLSGPMNVPILTGAAQARVDATGTYRFEPATDELRLEVTSAQYEKWRPAASLGGGAGAPIDLIATVVKTNGQPAQVEVDRFVWELIDTSSEPGIAMNWPREAADSDYDLRFEALVGQVTEGEQKQRAIQQSPKGVQDTARVLPYDWGGWSILRVNALLKDGRRLTGKYKGAGEDDVRLPKRKAGSLIADGWKEERSVDEADSADEENEPEGDSNRGDGLTLYEEYRGFYENSAHIEGKPKKKDYFALNYSGSRGMGGIRHFQRISGLEVHGKLLRNELSSARVINSNHRSAPHHVDQHGVIIRDATFRGYSAAVPVPDAPKSPGPPGNFEYVGLSSQMPSVPTASAAVSYASATIAHELLHTASVWHHGGGDRSVVWLLDDRGDVAEVEGGAGLTIGVLDEAGAVLTGGVRASLSNGGRLQRELGVSGGQHSGVENCVMRYDIADTYVMKGTASWRYSYYAAEVPGAGLCGSAAGTSVNESGRGPQSRYGDASPKRGDCKHQIMVNDSVTPAQR